MPKDLVTETGNKLALRASGPLRQPPSEAPRRRRASKIIESDIRAPSAVQAYIRFSDSSERGNYDVAAVLSNDSDLVEPIRIVTQVLGKPVGLLSPVANPNLELAKAASFIRRISVRDLAAS